MGSSRGAGSDRLMRPSRDPAGWTADEMAATDAWLHTLTGRERAEVHDAVEKVVARGLDFFAIDRDAFALPGFGPKLARSAPSCSTAGASSCSGGSTRPRRPAPGRRRLLGPRDAPRRRGAPAEREGPCARPCQGHRPDAQQRAPARARTRAKRCGLPRRLLRPRRTACIRSGGERAPSSRPSPSTTSCSAPPGPREALTSPSTGTAAARFRRAWTSGTPFRCSTSTTVGSGKHRAHLHRTLPGGARKTGLQRRLPRCSGSPRSGTSPWGFAPGRAVHQRHVTSGLRGPSGARAQAAPASG